MLCWNLEYSAKVFFQQFYCSISMQNGSRKKCIWCLEYRWWKKKIVWNALLVVAALRKTDFFLWIFATSSKYKIRKYISCNKHFIQIITKITFMFFLLERHFLSLSIVSNAEALFSEYYVLPSLKSISMLKKTYSQLFPVVFLTGYYTLAMLSPVMFPLTVLTNRSSCFVVLITLSLSLIMSLRYTS